MHLAYISPSILPSRSANAVHVVHMCHAFARLGVDVTLFAKRSIPNATHLAKRIEEDYGVDYSGIRLVTYHSTGSRGNNARIAWMALRHMARHGQSDLVLSRNLYAAYWLGVLRGQPLIFETHQLEYGLRKYLQAGLIARPNVQTIVISARLARALHNHHGREPMSTLILHDAAPAGIGAPQQGRELRTGTHWLPIVDRAEALCGYFGHLYPGRGIEIIKSMAAARPKVAFVVFGGTEADIEANRSANRLPNLHFQGFLSHREVLPAMAAVDVLLMPYQRSVSIGVHGHDTADWMSPMKMFEYMASGTPFIASRLPALEEVLHDGKNALLAAPDDPAEWLSCLDRLIADKPLATNLAGQAYAEYSGRYNWTARAARILAELTRDD